MEQGNQPDFITVTQYVIRGDVYDRDSIHYVHEDITINRKDISWFKSVNEHGPNMKLKDGQKIRPATTIKLRNESSFLVKEKTQEIKGLLFPKTVVNRSPYGY